MKQKRTVEFKLRVLQLHLVEKVPAKESFAQACKEFDTTPSGCMTDYSTGYMWDYKVEIKKKSLTDEKVNKFLIDNQIKL